MLNRILEYRQRVLDGGLLGFDQACALEDCPEVLIPYLGAAANEIRKHFCGDKVELCSLINARRGNCSEDCAFCGQSGHNAAGKAKTWPLVETDEILRQAQAAKAAGADEFCIVTSGKGASNDADFERIIEAARRIREETGLRVGCSLGFLSPEQAARLKAAGVFRANHNLETARDFYPQIVSTHNWEQRFDQARVMAKSGINLCCGGIIGMGESMRQRIEMAFSLRELKTDCVPINILNRIPGTRLENAAPIAPLEVIKTIAVFRFIHPKATVKIAGGRQTGLRDLQANALMSGANGIILGDYLTTPGSDKARDLQMLADIGLKPDGIAARD